MAQLVPPDFVIRETELKSAKAKANHTKDYEISGFGDYAA